VYAVLRFRLPASRLPLLLPSAMEQSRDAQAQHSHLSAAEPPALDNEEVDVSDLEEEEEARNKTPSATTATTKKQGAASTLPTSAPRPAPPAPSLPQAQPPAYQQQQQPEPLIRPRMEPRQQAAMPLNLPPPPPHHLEWFHHAHAQAAAAASAATGHYPLGPPPLPSSVQPHQQHTQLPAVAPAPFPGLRGLGLSPLYHHRHSQLPHGGHPSQHDPNKRHTWTTEEDRRLKELVQTVGPKKWGVISTHFNNRNAKQCHQRWHYVLKPCITREPWTEEEDQAIMQYQAQIGNKWSHIAKYLSGRTGYAIRNRYNFLQKRLLEENQRHLRPFLGPPLALQMYAAAAAAAAAASGGGGEVGGQGTDVVVQQDGEGGEGEEGGEEGMEDDEDAVPMDEDEQDEGGEEEMAGDKDDHAGQRGQPRMLLEPLPVPTGWTPALSAPSPQFASSYSSSSTSSTPRQLPTPTNVPTSSLASNTTISATSSSATMSSEPPSLAHAFASTPASSSSTSSSAAHGTCKASPAAAAGLSSSLSTSLSGGGSGGAGAPDFHEQQYHEQQKHGSHSSFENAVFANLELMAMAAGQQQQVPVPTPAPTPTTTTTTQTREGEGELGKGKGAEGGQQQGEVEKGGVVVAVGSMQEA